MCKYVHPCTASYRYKPSTSPENQFKMKPGNLTTQLRSLYLDNFPIGDRLLPEVVQYWGNP